VLLTGKLVETAQVLAADPSRGTIKVPPPPVALWPVVGKPFQQFWLLASVNLREALAEIGPHLKPFGQWLLVGLFEGAIVLALGDTLFLAWLQDSLVAATAPRTPEEHIPVSPEAAAETPASDRTT
jgi:hypothetical protein